MSLRRKIEAYYQVKGLPITENLDNMVSSSMELGLSDDEVLENLAARAKARPAHLTPGAEVLLLRSIGWIRAKLAAIEADGYVVEWTEADGEVCHKIVGFETSTSIRP
eukprot:gene1001-1533_t